MFFTNFTRCVPIVFDFLLDVVRKLYSGPLPLDVTSFRLLFSTEANEVDDLPTIDSYFTPTGIKTLNCKRLQKPCLSNDDNIGLHTPPDHKSVVPLKQSAVGEVIDVSRIRCKLQTSRFDREFVTDGLVVTGDFGEIYKCTNLLDGVAYAIKKTKKTVHKGSRRRFVCEEVRAHSMIGRHPNIVSYFSAWHERDHVYIQTELCNGGTLERMIHKSDRVFCDSALRRLLCHVCRGLAHIHSNRYAHMDIRSANILICHTGCTFLFGVQLYDRNETIDRDIVYKIGNFRRSVYVEDFQTDRQNSPKELLRNDYSELQKGDMFSTAIVVYEAATKSHSPKDKLQWNSEFSSLQIPTYSKVLDRILKKMVDFDPTQRPNASAVVKQLLDKATI